MVLESYAAAVRAITTAQVRNDPSWRGLTGTLINPELAQLRDYIQAERYFGFHDGGMTRIISSQVVSYRASLAQVRACVYSTLVVYQRNGQPAPGNSTAGSGRTVVEQATLVRRSSRVGRGDDRHCINRGPGRSAMQRVTPCRGCRS